MYPGKYPFRATFKRPTVSSDEIGNQSSTMQEIGRAWIALEPLSGREYVAAAQTQAETTHKILLRTPDFSIDNTCIVECQGNVYEIDSAPLDYLKGEISLTAKVKSGSA